MTGLAIRPISVNETSQPAGYVTSNTDCDDGDNTIYPNAPELADNKDNDCDGETDEGISTYYRDADGDTFGDANDTVQAPSPPVGYVSQPRDCDDGNTAVHPGASEEPYNGMDDDCNPSTPDDDLDGDGYVNAQDCDG